MTTVEMVEPRMLIGGELTAGSGDQRVETIDPSTGEVLAEVPMATTADVDRAVRSAAGAAREWGQLTARERARPLLELARRVRAMSERLAYLDAIDGGMPIRMGRVDVERAAERLEYTAALAQDAKGETFSSPRSSLSYSLRQPYGVVAVINPFNHPLLFTLVKAAAPLATGNTVVVKPPSEAPLSALEVARTIAEVLPAGVFNVVTGSGVAIGHALAGHPLVGKVSFTGSVATGRAVLHATADNVVPVALELGGKNAVVVCADADVDRALEGVLSAMSLAVCGQSCQSGTRLFLHADLYDDFLERLVAKVNAVRIGIAREETTEMGPMISARQLEIVDSYIAGARAGGARLVTGGSRPADADLADGFFIRPTIFDRVDPSMRIAREEIFGPVLSVFSWDDERELITAVNAVDYGLTASVWSRGIRVHDLVRAIEASYVWVNKFGGGPAGTAPSGWKRSGLGLSHSREPLLDWTRMKIVDMRTE